MSDEIRQGVQGHDFPSRHFLGVDVASCKGDQVIDYLTERMGRNEKSLLAFANTNLLNFSKSNPEFQQVMRSFFVINDGIGLDIASWIKYREFFPENLNGTDFTPRLLEATRGRRLYLYGSREEVVSKVAQLLKETYQCQVVGHQHGFIDQAAQDSLYQDMNARGAEIVLVAMGNPRQEQWIYNNRDKIDAPLMMGVGALFDFLSGDKKRAPMWMRRARIEWLARLLQEPGRLVKRYTVDIAWFLFAVVRETLGQGRSAANASR